MIHMPLSRRTRVEANRGEMNNLYGFIREGRGRKERREEEEEANKGLDTCLDLLWFCLNLLWKCLYGY